MYEIKSTGYSRKEIEVLERLLNEECLKIYRETKAVKFDGEYQFCEDAVIVCSPDINPEIVKYPDKDCYNLFQIKDDKIEVIDIPSSGIPYIRYPVSGPFFRRAEFYYGFDFGKRQCCLIYQFGPRWGRCLMYQLLCADEHNYFLGDSKDVWVL